MDKLKLKFWYHFYTVTRKLGLWKLYYQEDYVIAIEPKWFFESKQGLKEFDKW